MIITIMQNSDRNKMLGPQDTGNLIKNVLDLPNPHSKGEVWKADDTVSHCRL